VTGSRASPYSVRLTLTRLSDEVWARAIAAMAAEARFAAELLAGQMPHEIEEAFAAAGASLFPAGSADLQTSCSCPDWANPCKHVAATHYVLGEALDADPFLLFELRGRTRDEVLGALRAARAGSDPEAGTQAPRCRPAAEQDEVPRVELEALGAEDYDRPRAPLPALRLGFERPAVPAALLRQLGAPAAWSSAASPVELLAPLLGAAAEEARRLALADPDEAPTAPVTVETTPPRPRPRSAPSPDAKKAPVRPRRK
jgi:uncharacterized Zn finger protein